jgi:hypothetical protein
MFFGRSAAGGCDAGEREVIATKIGACNCCFDLFSIAAFSLALNLPKRFEAVGRHLSIAYRVLYVARDSAAWRIAEFADRTRDCYPEPRADAIGPKAVLDVTCGSAASKDSEHFRIIQGLTPALLIQS